MDDVTHAQLIYSSARDLLGAALAELNSFNALVKDEPETPFIHRLKARVMFAVVEAHIVHLQTVAYAASKINPRLFTEDETLRLQGKRRRKDGSVENARISLKDSVKFAFSAFARARGIVSPVNFDSKGGRDFLQAVEIRDRITHPKTAADWKMSATDDEHIDGGWVWLGALLVDASRTSNKPG